MEWDGIKMININNVVLVGRLTKDPDLRKTQSDISVLQFTLAVGRKFKSEGQSEADFIQCIAWKQSAEYLAQYARKGTIVSVEGRIQTRSYDGSNGKVFITEINTSNVQIIAQERSANVKKEIANDDTSKLGGYASRSIDDLNINPEELPFY